MSSQVLGRDIEEIREKVERMKEKKNNESEGVKLARQSVEQCYLYVGVGVCVGIGIGIGVWLLLTILTIQGERGQAAGLLETSRGVQD